MGSGALACAARRVSRETGCEGRPDEGVVTEDVDVDGRGVCGESV